MAETIHEENRRLEQVAEDITCEGMVAWFLKWRQDFTEFRNVFWKLETHKRQFMTQLHPQLVEDMEVMHGYMRTMAARLHNER